MLAVGTRCPAAATEATQANMQPRYNERVVIDAVDEASAQFAVPFDNDEFDNGEKEHHIILMVRDDGNPPLSAYRRVFVRAPSGEDIPESAQN
jgi:hypothetical protein